jgi:segregation and condensation protein B
MIDNAKLQCIIEGALLAAGKPVPLEKLQELFLEGEKPEPAQFDEVLVTLGESCAGRGFELKKVASGYRLQVKQEYSEWVSRLWEEKPQKYSRAVMETLSIIAYRQPITRGDIEKIRGVAVSTQIVQTLLEHEWVRVVGYRDVPGRPAMYATTKQFLDYFNLSALEELPALAEIRDLQSANRELSLDEDKPVGRIIEFPEVDATADDSAIDEAELAAAAIGTRPISEILSDVDNKLAQAREAGIELPVNFDALEESEDGSEAAGGSTAEERLPEELTAEELIAEELIAEELIAESTEEPSVANTEEPSVVENTEEAPQSE